MPDSSSPLALASLFGLDGKVAVVTGGSRGIGFMIASGLVANGVRTYITARKAEACDAAAAELSGARRVHLAAGRPVDAGGTRIVRQRRSPNVSRRSTSWSTMPVPPGARPSASSRRWASTRCWTSTSRRRSCSRRHCSPSSRRGATADDPARVIMIGSIDGIRVPVGDNYSYSASKAGIHMMARHMAAHLVRATSRSTRSRPARSSRR